MNFAKAYSFPLLHGPIPMPAHICLAEEAWQVTAKIWEPWAKGLERSGVANQANRTWGESARKANNQITKLPGKDEAKDTPRSPQPPPHPPEG